MVAEALQQIVADGIALFGEGQTLVIERPVGLYDAVTDAAPALQAAVTIAAGSSTLTLECSGTLSGSAPAGAVVTIGGQSYTVTTDSVASGGEIVLNVTPVTVAEIAIGTIATISATVQLTYSRAVESMSIEQRSRLDSILTGSDEVVHLGPHAVAPQRGDVTNGGQTVSHVLTVGDPSYPAGYTVVLGNRGGGAA